MKKIDIYINSIHDLEIEKYNDTFKLYVLGGNEFVPRYRVFTDNYGQNISEWNKGICEFTGMYHVRYNQNLGDIIGFYQYRKHLNVKTSDIEDILNEYDIILPKKLHMTTNVLAQYAYFHNADDVVDLAQTIVKYYPEYVQDYKDFFNSKSLYTNNCFIMKTEMFIRYCDFIWGVISHFLNDNGYNTFDDCVKHVEENKDKYLKKIPNASQNGTVEYQARFLAYLIERLTNIFINHNCQKIFETDMAVMELKYDMEKKKS